MQVNEPDRADALYMIGNAHLDPVWLWTWQEGLQEAKATFRSVLQLMNEYDDFLFTSSSAAIYQWIETNDPDMFQEIKARVAEGRWELAGGWWIQPDCNLPSGESFVRQGLYGQRYFRSAFGVLATVGYNVDSFGHAASLPQILRKSGMSAYIFMRPHPHEQHLPGRLFQWESDDGSRVLAYRIPYEYATWGRGLEQHVDRCAAELRGNQSRLMCFYGVGNHGGGPTRENLESIRRMNAEPEYPTLLFSTPSRYFRDIKDESRDAPVFRDELQHHASGCYAAHSGVKRWNRKAENQLVLAEKLSLLMHRIVGLPYPADFEHAWRNVLFNQFHDILAGTSIEPAYDDARDQYGEAMAIASRHQNNAMQALSWRIDIPEEADMRPIVAFNPHSWPLVAHLELETGRMRDGDVLEDSRGTVIPFQIVTSRATVSPGSRNRLCFSAELPSMGYEVFRLVPRAGAGQTEHLPATESSIENDFFRLEINADTGCLASLHDKRHGFEWLRREAARLVVISDPSDTWSHGILRFDTEIGQFSPTAVELVEHGPVRSTLRVESHYGQSRVVQQYILYRDLERIDVRVTVDWREHFKMLKINFPLNLYNTTVTYEIPYGTISRPANGEEEPGGAWVDLTGIGRNDGRRMGMSLLNDGKYSYDTRQHEINLTVLRSPIYAHHDPYVPEEGKEYSFIDQGIQHFVYSLLPHTASWETAGTVQQAAALNQPPIALFESYHPGPLPRRDSYLQIDPANIVVSALKKSEDGDDTIIRCLETAGIATQATLTLPAWHRSVDLSFGPNELKTLRIPASPDVPVIETSLIELDDLG